MGALIRPPAASDRRTLRERAVGWRSGTAVSVDRVPATPADAPIFQWSASYGPVDDRTPAGGAGLDSESARAAAIGELLERYAAVSCPLPLIDRSDAPTGERLLDHDQFSLHSAVQRRRPEFPYADSYHRSAATAVYDLSDNSRVWVPANLVGNDPGLGHLATSNGLAAAATTGTALLRAAQELIERDALMITWLHQIGSRRVPAPAAIAQITDPIGAEVVVFDITPAYSPHPVAAVAGSAPLAGRDRNAFGLACRADFEEATLKAAIEWAQGASFAGVNTAGDSPTTATAPDDVTDFDQHAIFYTRRPDLWRQLPIWAGEAADPPSGRPAGEHHDQLADLVTALGRHGIELFYRDLTLPDLAGAGVRAVRVLSPQLLPIHSDHRWPHLGGTAAELSRRYPWARGGEFPSPFPHPLG